VSM
jgi:fermentation-respiration switch protein FrsA (DUF1100 family)